jgi:hypothetical protein
MRGIKKRSLPLRSRTSTQRGRIVRISDGLVQAGNREGWPKKRVFDASHQARGLSRTVWYNGRDLAGIACTKEWLSAKRPAVVHQVGQEQRHSLDVGLVSGKDLVP